MKNLLGKFHAELSQQRLASQAEPSQAKPSLLTTAYHGLPRLILPGLFLKGVLVLKGTSDITACQCLALLSTAWQCLALLSTSGLVSGGARGAMAPPKF